MSTPEPPKQQPIPSLTSPSVQEAAAKARRLAILAKGRASTDIVSQNPADKLGMVG